MQSDTRKRPPRLSATFVRTVNTPGRYGDGYGGHGLSLLVKPAAHGRLSKSWAQAIRPNRARFFPSEGAATPPLPNRSRTASANAATPRQPTVDTFGPRTAAVALWAISVDAQMTAMSHHRTRAA